MGEGIVIGIVCFVLVMVSAIIFMCSSSKNNQEYNEQSSQEIFFKEYIDSKVPAFVKYIGDDRVDIRCSQYTLITIDSTEDNKIKVDLEDSFIIYDDFKHFNYDWRFEDEW